MTEDGVVFILVAFTILANIMGWADVPKGT